MEAEDMLREALIGTEKLVIKQKIELLEIAGQNLANAVGMESFGAIAETANKYDVFSTESGLTFRVEEKSAAIGCEGCCPTGRICCRPNHKLRLNVYDAEEDTEVMVIDRPCKIGQCCACCKICSQEMTVYMGDGSDEDQRIAYINQPFMAGGFSPALQIMDRDNDEDPSMFIKSENACCIGGLCCDHTFTITDPDGVEMGKIVKERPETLSQLATELTGDADIFTLQLQKDIDFEKKAAMLASLHLLDYMFFEDEGQATFDLANMQCSYKCCDIYCCGCLCPCKCACGGGGKEVEDT